MTVEIRREGKKNWLKKTLWLAVLLFAVLNSIALFHSYHFTHFSTEEINKTKDAGKLSLGEKIKTLFFGVNNPRPENSLMPEAPFDSFILNSNKKIECWSIKTPEAKGTIILFHGYGGTKSSMLDKAELFRKQGFSTLLVDFMGSGGSEGNQTTIGFFESEQVKSCVDYLKNKGEKNIFLFGTSMGAVAVMKAINDYDIKPKGIIIECPFGSMYKTVCARFKSMNVPTFPMAGFLVFWGGVQNRFWAFSHNPTTYAKNINCPTLLLYGAKDEKVSAAEIKEIFKNLSGKKKLKIYDNAGHENYLRKYKNEWEQDIYDFLTYTQ